LPSLLVFETSPNTNFKFGISFQTGSVLETNSELVRVLNPDFKPVQFLESIFKPVWVFKTPDWFSELVCKNILVIDVYTTGF